MSAPTWAECHAAGMTAREAAQARGMDRHAAYQWARRSHVKWLPEMGIPVTVRGVTYPAIAIAARALGVSTSTIQWHLETYGHADGVGAGVQRPARHGGPKRAITLGGVTYPSGRAAAADLGVHEQTVAKWRRRPTQALARILMERDARIARERALERDGRPPSAPVGQPGGRKRSEASIDAERLLREGMTTRAASEMTGLSMKRAQSIAAAIREERKAA